MTKIEEIERAIDAAILEAAGGQLDARLVKVSARAAVEAMREPTESMMFEGATTDVGVAHTADYRGRCLTPSHVWQAMIDAILNEKPEGGG